MAMQKESGSCTGYKFAVDHANGWLAKLYTWITKSLSTGGPGWNMLIDRTDTPVNKLIESVNTTTDEITITNHGFLNGERVSTSTTGTFPGGLFTSNSCYVHYVDENTFKLSSGYYRDGYEGTTVIDIYSSGSGNSYVKRAGSYIVVSNEANPDINGGKNAQIWRIGHWDYLADRIYMQMWISPGVHSNALPYGIVGGYWLIVDSGTYQYDFRGGEEFIFLQSYVSGTWMRAGSDRLTPLPNFVEDFNTVYGKVNSGSDDSYTPGLNPQVVTLENTQQANSFTVGKWYFVIFFGVDLSGNNIGNISFGRLDAVGTAGGLNANQIRFDYLGRGNIHDYIYHGAIVSPYYHMYCSLGTQIASISDIECMNRLVPACRLCIPYCSYYSGTYRYGANNNYQDNEAECSLSYDFEIINKGIQDNQKYPLQKGLVCELYNAGNLSQTEMENAYGEMRNFGVAPTGKRTEMSGYWTIDGENWLCLGESSYIANSFHQYDIDLIVLDTESV